VRRINRTRVWVATRIGRWRGTRLERELGPRLHVHRRKVLQRLAVAERTLAAQPRSVRRGREYAGVAHRHVKPEDDGVGASVGDDREVLRGHGAERVKRGLVARHACAPSRGSPAFDALA